MVAVAKYESGYNPKSRFKESTGQDSIGLYQLSYGDHNCPKTKAEGNLEDPVTNIVCAVYIASDLIGDDLVVASGGYKKFGAQPPRGMARYWAVIREKDSKRPHKKAEIKASVTSLKVCH